MQEKRAQCSHFIVEDVEEDEDMYPVEELIEEKEPTHPLLSISLNYVVGFDGPKQ